LLEPELLAANQSVHLNEGAIKVNTRRNVLLSGLGTALSSLSGKALSQSSATDVALTDPVRKAVLSRPRIKTLHENAVGGDLRSVLSAQTPLVLEQNIARFGDRRLHLLFSSLTDDELQLMSVIYTKAVASYGIRPHLLDMLAQRLSPSDLGRLSRHFGFAPVYEALVRRAPQKAFEFERHSHPNFMAPGPWSPIPQPSTRRPVKFLIDESSPSYFKRVTPTIEYTIYEIYLSYRTAPVGALGVNAALYETAVFAGQRLAFAYGAGYTVGTVLSSLIQTYAPALHNSIGGAIYNVVNWLSDAASTNNISQIGYQQQNSSGVFQLGNTAYFFPTSSDFDITYEWNFMQGGGSGCGGDPDGCPIEQ
jgi:hypothetical protein